MVKSSANIDPLTGKLYVARGHGYIMNMATAFYGVYHQAPYECQGFINEENEYLDRKEAFAEAMKCGQIIEDTYGNQNLYSEDIWEQIEDRFYELPATEKTKQIAEGVVSKYGRKQFTETEDRIRRAMKVILADSYFDKYLKESLKDLDLPEFKLEEKVLKVKKKSYPIKKIIKEYIELKI
ncbi:MAG: hypothetical protein WCX60_06610 [Anaerovoracaceae bacterium]